jgi:hypothetical protein
MAFHLKIACKQDSGGIIANKTHLGFPTIDLHLAAADQKYRRGTRHQKCNIDALASRDVTC